MKTRKIKVLLSQQPSTISSHLGLLLRSLSVLPQVVALVEELGGWTDGRTDGQMGEGRVDGRHFQNVSWSNPPLVRASVFMRPSCSPALTSVL